MNKIDVVYIHDIYREMLKGKAKLLYISGRPSIQFSGFALGDGPGFLRKYAPLDMVYLKYGVFKDE
ncbi:MAG: hypothetical protein WC523_04895 [Patescibacteria group bacterium]